MSVTNYLTFERSKKKTQSTIVIMIAMEIVSLKKVNQESNESKEEGDLILIL